MKCVYCSTPISRTDWFCPNCKRGIRRSRRRPYAQAAVAIAGVAGGLLLLRAAPAPRRAAPVVRDVEPVPVTVRPVSPESSVAEVAAAAAVPPRFEASSAPPQVARAEAPRAVPPQPRVSEPPASPRGTAAVSVSTDSGMDTYVYLNGGSLLGKAPIEEAQIPAGNQTLVFWTPAIGGRSTRQIRMAPGQKVVLMETISRSDRFAPSEGG